MHGLNNIKIVRKYVQLNNITQISIATIIMYTPLETTNFDPEDTMLKNHETDVHNAL
jgi:lysophospholipase L1-like esterase